MSTILVVADRLEQKPVAIKNALKLAGAYGANLHVVYFCYDNLRHVQGDKEQIKQQIIQQLTAKAQAQISDIAPETEVSLEVVWTKHLHQWVSDYVASHQPVLVMKTGNRSESLMYTSTDWHLLRECQSPVLIASGKKWRRSNNVMAAIDLGTSNADKQALNHKVLAYARKLADYFGVEMHVCYVPHVSPLLRDLGVKFMDEEELKAEKALNQEIHKLAEQYAMDKSAFHIHAGLPHKVIPSEAAECKAGVVVLGTAGRAKLTGKLIGNTAEKILPLLKTDVIALKP